MYPLPTRATRTNTPFPFTTLFRSRLARHAERLQIVDRHRRRERRQFLARQDMSLDRIRKPADGELGGNAVHQREAAVEEENAAIGQEGRVGDRKSTRLNSSQ